PEGPTSYALQAITFADGTSWTPGTTSAFNTLETAGADNGESVAGGSGDDTLVADGANDTLTGGTGTQTFRFGSGFGQDTIVLNDAASANTIQFEAGINASEVSFASNGTDLVMTVTGSTGTDGQPSTLTLPNYLGGTASTITTRILFGDGVSISMAQINQLLQQSGGAPVQYTGTVLTAGAGDVSLSSDGGIDTLIGGAGNDTLIGGDGQDLLELGSGNTQINGGNGQETYQFSPGFGQDTLTPSGPADDNTIRFGGGITAADVSFSLDYSSLLVTVGNSIGADGQASTITLPVYHGYINGNETTSTNIGQFIFADGSTASMAQLFELLAQSNGQPVRYSGGTTLTAGAGNELLEGDGSANTLIGGAGDDTLMGNYGQDLLEAGTGNSLLIGGTGDEMYQFVSGFGQDTITTIPAARGNTIQFIGDISPDKVTFKSDFSDLLILLDGSVGPDGQPSVIRVPDYFAGNGTGALSQIVFGNGTVAPMGAIDQLLKQSSGAPVHYVPPGTVITAGPGNVEITSDNGNDTLIGGTGNDTLVGGSGTDVLEAGTGNDLLVGGSGRETYAFGSGFGQDTITADATGASSSIQFGAGISAADLSFQAAGDNLVISVVGSIGADGLPSQVTLLNYFSGGAPATNFGQIGFDDGSTIVMTRVNQALAASSTLEGTVVQVVPAGVLITAPNNKDTLTGIDGDDTLNAGSGQDVLQAGSGNDVLNAGIGKDILLGGSGNDTLNGGSGNDLLQAGTGNDVLKAGSGKNTLIGGSGVDLLVAGTGPDIMQGGTGTQTYEFGTSFGKTTIEVSPNEQGANTIHFTAGVAPADLSYKQHKSDLVITVTVDGSSSTIIISNHFASGLPAANDVSEITFADGSVVTMAQINQQFADDQLHTSTNGLHWANRGFDDPAPHILQPVLSGLDGSRQGGFRGMSRGFANGVVPANPFTAPLQVNDSEKLALPTWSGSSGAAALGAESYSPGEPSIPTNGIGLPSLPATMQPMSGSREAPGAPVDPLADDPDDVSVQRSDNWLSGAMDAPVAPREDATASAWSSSLARSLVRGGGVHAAHVANDMVKALRAQADLRAPGMESSAQSPAQIQLQGGAIWSLSTLDRTLAELSFAGDALPASRGYASASGADLAHAQLVSAMASFSPLAAAESIPPDVTSEAYAIALAVHAH
ncbi:MAG TPA: calcium-binding protein, partial [Rhodanobacteraceae bacterium]